VSASDGAAASCSVVCQEPVYAVYSLWISLKIYRFGSVIHFLFGVIMKFSYCVNF